MVHTVEDTWDTVKSYLLSQYGPSAVGYLQQSILLDWTQGEEETVTQYADDVYKRLSLTGTEDPIAWHTFVKGLKPDLRTYVLTHKPQSFHEAQTPGLEAEQDIVK